MPIDSRPEGVYCQWSTYPPEGGTYASKLLTIERVYGNGYTSTVILTKAEAAKILKAIIHE